MRNDSHIAAVERLEDKRLLNAVMVFDDSYQLAQQSSLAAPSVVLDVLANDSSAAGGLTITSVQPPLHGSVTIQHDLISAMMGLPPARDTLLFTPSFGFTGTETLTYTVTDAAGNEATATVTLTIPPTPNDPPQVANLHLMNDTGTAGDNVTSDPTVTGTLTDDGFNALGNGMSMMSSTYAVQIDLGGDGSVEQTVSANWDHTFHYAPSSYGLNDGTVTIQARAVETGSNGSTLFGDWQTLTFTYQADSAGSSTGTGFSGASNGYGSGSMSVTSFWQTTAGLTIQAGFDAANAAYQQALADSSGLNVGNDQAALDLFNAGLSAAGASQSAANQTATSALTSAASAASNAAHLTIQAAESAFNSGEQSANAIEAGATQAAEAAFNAAQQAASNAQYAANQSAEALLNAAKQSATDTMNATIAAASNTLGGVMNAAEQVYQATAQAAQQTYSTAMSAYWMNSMNGGGSPPPITTPFDPAADSTYQSDLAAASAASSAAYAAAQSAYDAAVAAARATADSASAPINAVYLAAIASNQAAFETVTAGAKAAYDSAVAAHHAAYQIAADAAETAEFNSLDFSGIAFHGAATTATVTFNAAITNNQSVFGLAVSGITSGLATAIAADKSAFDLSNSAIEADYLSAHESASTDYNAIVNNPASSTGDINDATDTYNAAMLAATTSKLTSLAAALAAQIGADAAASGGAAHAYTAQSAARQLADVAAANARAHTLNGASAAMVVSDSGAVTTYQVAIDSAVAAESQAIARSAADCAKAINAAVVIQGIGNAAAGNTAVAANASIFADMTKSLADARAARETAFAEAGTISYVGPSEAMATAMNRWAAAQGTPEATYQAALVGANATKMSTVATAYAVYSGVYHHGLAQWVADVAPAAVSNLTAISNNAVTAFNAVANAAQTNNVAVVNAALSRQITSTTLSQSLADAKAGADGAWIAAVAPAVEGAANVQANNAATKEGAAAALNQMLADIKTDNATAKIRSDTNAVVALSSAQAMLLTALASQLPTASGAPKAPILPTLDEPLAFGLSTTPLEESTMFGSAKKNSENILLNNVKSIRAFAESLLPATKASDQDLNRNYSGPDIGAFAAGHRPDLWADALNSVGESESRERRVSRLSISLGTQGSAAGLGRNREEISRANERWQGAQRDRMVSALAEYIRLLKQAGDEKAILALKRGGLSAGVNVPGGVTPAELEAALRGKLQPEPISPF